MNTIEQVDSLSLERISRAISFQRIRGFRLIDSARQALSLPLSLPILRCSYFCLFSIKEEKMESKQVWKRVSSQVLNSILRWMQFLSLMRSACVQQVADSKERRKKRKRDLLPDSTIACDRKTRITLIRTYLLEIETTGFKHQLVVQPITVFSRKIGWFRGLDKQIRPLNGKLHFYLTFICPYKVKYNWVGPN